MEREDLGTRAKTLGVINRALKEAMEEIDKVVGVMLKIDILRAIFMLHQ